MKKVQISIIGILSFIIIGMVAYLSFMIITGKISEGSDFMAFQIAEVQLVNTQEVSLNEIEKLSISYKKSPLDIIFLESDTDQLIIREYMAGNPQPGELFSLDQNGSSLMIQGGEHKGMVVFLGIIIGQERLEIELPKNYQKELYIEASSGNVSCDFAMKLGKTLNISTKSGDISLKKVQADDIHLGSTSGNITVDELEGTTQCSAKSGDAFLKKGTGKLLCSTTSGNIKLREWTGDAKFSTNSGNISCDMLTGDLETSSTSGNTDIKDLYGKISANVTSGNIQVGVASLKGDIILTSTSGNVTLKLLEGESFSFQAKSNSGSFYTDFEKDDSENTNKKEGTIGKNPAGKVQIKTSSGSIRIKKK